MKGGGLMAALYVEISPAILDWIIKRTEIEGNSSVNSLLIEWRKGTKKPTFHQIEQISKKIHIPLGYFFLKKPPMDECPLTEFRTIDSIDANESPSADLVDTIDMMLNIQDWMRDYVKDMGQEKKSYVASCSEDMPFAEIVAKIRQGLQLTENWMIQQKNVYDSFKFLRIQCQKVGILVMMNGVVGNNTHRKLNVNEFRAFTIVDKYVPLIFINAQDSMNGRLFSLLHEVAHIWIGLNSIYNENETNIEQIIRPIEKKCNAVTAELLVPHRLFIPAWKENKNSVLEKIDILSKFFTCSPVVIARKALDLQYIQKQTYNEIVAKAVKIYKDHLKEKKSGGDYYKTMANRLDPQFVFAVTASAQSGRTPFSDIYRLTNTNRTTFEHLYKKLLLGEGGVHS